MSSRVRTAKSRPVTPMVGSDPRKQASERFVSRGGARKVLVCYRTRQATRLAAPQRDGREYGCIAARRVGRQHTGLGGSACPCGSPAQVKSRFVRLLDLDNRILVDENFKRRHAQCLSRTVLIRTILCLYVSPINLRS